jgi:hypothetical protein
MNPDRYFFFAGSFFSGAFAVALPGFPQHPMAVPPLGS